MIFPRCVNAKHSTFFSRFFFFSLHFHYYHRRSFLLWPCVFNWRTPALCRRGGRFGVRAVCMCVAQNIIAIELVADGTHVTTPPIVAMWSAKTSPGFCSVIHKTTRSLSVFRTRIIIILKTQNVDPACWLYRRWFTRPQQRSPYRYYIIDPVPAFVPDAVGDKNNTERIWSRNNKIKPWCAYSRNRIDILLFGCGGDRKDFERKGSQTQRLGVSRPFKPHELFGFHDFYRGHPANTRNIVVTPFGFWTEMLEPIFTMMFIFLE